MGPKIRLVQINIEGSKHLDRVLDSLSSKNDLEVVCVQELFESDVPLIEEKLNAKCVFAPMYRKVVDGSRKIQGIGIFSKLAIKESRVNYYWGDGNVTIDFDTTDDKTKHETQSYALLRCDLGKRGSLFRIATTHFTWTPDGEASEFQRQDMKELLKLLENANEFVLCGDFNAPRGGEIFTMLADRLKDNVPQEYTTSIDGDFHRAGPLELMVDGIFSTKGYKVSEVERVCGVSDHCAFTATVQKSLGRSSLD